MNKLELSSVLECHTIFHQSQVGSHVCTVQYVAQCFESDSILATYQPPDGDNTDIVTTLCAHLPRAHSIHLLFPSTNSSKTMQCARTHTHTLVDGHQICRCRKYISLFPLSLLSPYTIFNIQYSPPAAQAAYPAFFSSTTSMDVATFSSTAKHPPLFSFPPDQPEGLPRQKSKLPRRCRAAHRHNLANPRSDRCEM